MPPGGGSDGPDVRQFIHEDELADLYGWLDDIPLSRPKRNITRDFADVGAPLSPSLPLRVALLSISSS